MEGDPEAEDRMGFHEMQDVQWVARAVGRLELQSWQDNEVVRLGRKAGASFRMDPQDQQEAGKVWLEGKTRASFRVELQGQEGAEA